MLMEKYERWLSRATDDKDLIAELESIRGSETEIKERFAVSLAFGTAGLRGVIGAGTNRMNIYMVRQATQGLANHLNAGSEPKRVAISFDSRIKSELFAHAAAEVLAANGIRVFIYRELMPVPALSFATRYLGCGAGVMVTASHNPSKYNGYKAYGPDGCQMTEEAADDVYREMQKTDPFDGVRTVPFEKALAEGRIEYIADEVKEELYRNVEAQSVRPGLCRASSLKLVYSPLNGSGNVPVRRVLADIGITDITVVPEQEYPDGNFPTCPYPNPEIRQALQKGLELAEKTGADLMLATDPDADRVGIAVRDSAGAYQLLTGNEVGALLLDYLCAARIENGTMPADPIMVKSIVSTYLADEIAHHYGVRPVNVLTGFKYIGEQIHLLEEKGEEKRFIFGFEESYGYLAGTYVRDKDAIVASMLIVEMAAYYVSRGSSILQQLEELYRTYGRYLNKVESFEFSGLSGMDKMKQLMAGLRAEMPRAFAGTAVEAVSDYESHTVTRLADGRTERIALPASNVLGYRLADGSQIFIRPSGTEPKIKAYYFLKGRDLAEAEKLLEKYSAAVHALLGV